MKKSIATFAFLLFILHSNGQVIKSIGIKSGLSVASQNREYKTDDSHFNEGSIKGFYGVVSVEFFQSKYFSLVTDLGYCQKGSSVQVPNTSVDLPEGDGTSSTYNSQFNYLIFNPMFKARYEFKNFIPYSFIGVGLDYQLAIESDFSYNSIAKYNNKTLFGFVTGAGLEYKIKRFGFNIEFQYQKDFTNVYDIPVSSNNAGLTVKNQALIYSLGFKYYFGKTATGN